MLQQTQVKTVRPYYERWMKALPSIAAVARAKPERILKLWEGLGYYSRARNLQRAAQLILARDGGKFPSEYEAILALPGIGRYTAGAVASIAFDQPKPILDGNAVRVLTRLFGIAQDPREKRTRDKLWSLAEELVVKAFRVKDNGAAGPVRPCAEFNQSLMELGALVCTPAKPRCDLCPVATLCVALQRGRVQQIPRSSRRARPAQRRFVAFLLKKCDRYLVRKRPAGVVNAHLWEFPNLEVAAAADGVPQAASSALGVAHAPLEPLGTIRHTITRYRITLEVFRAGWIRGDQVRDTPNEGKWLGPRALRQLPFASAHRKILHRWILGRKK